MTAPHGLLLAAGAGRRLGTPKALVRDPDGRPWVSRATEVLLDGGCGSVTVVLGASADEAEWVLADGLPDLTRVEVVRAHDWEEGMAASLRAGLRALVDHPSPGEETLPSAVVHLVDLPDVGADVVARVVALAALPGHSPSALLARAAFDGRPGHPVVLGRDHWRPVLEIAGGDRGARDYLAEHTVELIECGDLATGRDVDVLG
ncbi:NTP transferase domain-containing protein [Nocardioides sp.]|uniref:nucleotidyltransferase family protein n=1 Tax=Nocardioides sp. TaxID=35761 RepID=UPI0035176F44